MDRFKQRCDFGTRSEKGTFSDHNGPKSNDSWIDLRRYLVKYIDPDSLMSLRVVDKAWQIVVDQRIDGLVGGGSILVHGDINFSEDKAEAWRRGLRM